jgi:geranylgeranyl pyrophosphate synthase
MGDRGGQPHVAGPATRLPYLVMAPPSTSASPVSATLSELDLRLITQVDEALGTFLNAVDLPPNLKSAVVHAVLAGGKRMRPLLVLHSAAAVGGSFLDAMPAAVAIELVHAFSLVHDDLPALDNDRMRRGRPTVWVAFGEAMAILAGDALLSLAIESATASPRAAGEITREIAIATTHMINGQVLDTLGGFAAQESDRDRLHRIHHNKTGALLVASCRMGGLSGGATTEQLAHLSRWGSLMGLMFQIVDDLLDETASAEQLGKAVGKDREAGKLTFPGVMGIEASRAEVARLDLEARNLVRELGPRAAPLQGLADFLATRTH